MIKYLQSKMESKRQKTISIYTKAIIKAKSDKEKDYLLRQLNNKGLTF